MENYFFWIFNTSSTRNSFLLPTKRHTVLGNGQYFIAFIEFHCHHLHQCRFHNDPDHIIIIAKSWVWTKLPTRQYRFPDQAQSTAHAWTPTVRQSASSLSSWLLSQCPIIITLAAAIDIVSLSSLSLLSSMLLVANMKRNLTNTLLKTQTNMTVFAAGKYILSYFSLGASVLWTFKPNGRKHESSQVEGRQGVRHTTPLSSSSWKERSSRWALLLPF